MKTITKYWKVPLQKAQTQSVRRTITANDCVTQKIRMAEIQLQTAFERESMLFLSEFQKPDCFHSTICNKYVSEVIHHHLNTLFSNCIKYYIHLCSLNYFSVLSKTQNSTLETSKSFIKLPFDEDLLEEIRNDLTEIIVSYYKTKENFEEYMAQKVEERKETISQIAEHIKSGWRQLSNYGYQLQIKGKLKNIKLSGRSQYSYICENSSSSCDVCMSLSGRIFNVDEAQTEKNLPPMHPNCRCTITAHPPLSELPEVPSVVQDTPIAFLWDIIEGAVQQLEGKLDNLADGVGDIWNYFFRESLEDTYGTYTTIMIDGVEYRINMASFESVVIMPDGTYLVPELVSEVDEQMLALMKERDSLAKGDPQIEELNDELKAIYESTDEAERHIDWEKPYSFYYFGGDATYTLNEYMRNAASKYSYMHNRYWSENIFEFYQLVRNGREMDLKNQPMWQNSAYSFDGEIVSQDALGNINYGFFGSYCNFPQSVLMAGAGYAQWQGGTWEWGFISTLLDDPRDTYRVFQGIEIYAEEN